MKKIFFAIALIFMSVSVSFAAVSGDQEVYLRKDVFDAKMDAFMAEIKLTFQNMREELHNEIQSVKSELHNEIQSVKTDLQNEIHRVETKVDVLTEHVHSMENNFDKRISSLETYLSWALAFMAIIVASATFLPIFGEPLRRLWQKIFSPQLTLEDVRRLIEENNEYLLSKINILQEK
ncbi:MAG: hypothetical protein IJP96_09170 [Synergistaceae bacterium]|nr:hypothetical protein [Synergistaceae bacterium]MBR0075909.1 hypothetical protein [Synergistaceae bacterium]MBR0079129.1 hypothetical protein [Synergistaceae bacterium]